MKLKRSRSKCDEEISLKRVCRNETKTILQPPKEDLDPIMRIPIGQDCFTFVRPNGTRSRFNIESLIDYMLASGDFCDPESRLPFQDDDLREIDKIVLSRFFDH
jgi:hypothetical protein